MSTLPSHHRALVVESTSQPLTLETRPTPCPPSAAPSYAFPTPLVPGASAIGRIASLGPDAVALQRGQLIILDCVVRARDDPATAILLAIHDSGSPRSQKLARDIWRDGTFAEYARVPLENCIPLDEKQLCGELGYEIPDLMHMSYLMVAFGGLRDIKLEPGETVLVAPATGEYGGAAVMVAIVMGARVIAMGGNEAELARLKKHVLKGSPGASIDTVQMVGDEMADAENIKKLGRTIDAVMDFTPIQASSLGHNGRISLMCMNENPMVAWTAISKNISFRCKLMYECEDILQLVKMLESGVFPRGKEFVDTKAFSLEDWQACIDAAAQHRDWQACSHCSQVSCNLRCSLRFKLSSQFESLSRWK
ncbi:hypothetical protein BU23DRAFT_592072 [Bimuria novae-zelandiae CBS 107.79]|uniref:Alcohol dehydrogenase-like N-terminal domain-containing protein n=1 Tax=Bimuria novae-zelandiae CBS 107.79 TaxID=1447943 RepID=A0A6A5V5F2_9PLEO|nr:hypothetical protein BU23DRAFT_592072 [Bimuria novae-zelandiae CBS 107.79]